MVLWSSSVYVFVYKLSLLKKNKGWLQQFPTEQEARNANNRRICLLLSFPYINIEEPNTSNITYNILYLILGAMQPIMSDSKSS